ncbi:MAG: hypothetical protein K8S97_00305 [Anaerolineae bacterium]|nr:hypothetical protein [Anaerolineae bacterium]
MFGNQLLCLPEDGRMQCDNAVLTLNMIKKIKPKTVEIGGRHVTLSLSPGQ